MCTCVLIHPLYLRLSLSRCSPMEHLCIVHTCWMTLAASLCWSWAFCCSPLCWFWLSLHTADWPDTSNWACVSFPTAAPSTRTCPPHATGAMAEAAVASRAVQRGKAKVVCGSRRGQADCIWYGNMYPLRQTVESDLLKQNFIALLCKNLSYLVICSHPVEVIIAMCKQVQCNECILYLFTIKCHQTC